MFRRALRGHFGGTLETKTGKSKLVGSYTDYSRSLEHTVIREGSYYCLRTVGHPRKFFLVPGSLIDVVD